MASIAMLIAGAAVNALAFSGSNYLFSSMGGGSVERKRHDEATEALNTAHEEWTKRRTLRLDWETNQARMFKKAADDFKSGSYSSEQAFRATEPPVAGSEPVLSDFYTPSSDQRDKEIGFLTIGLTTLGVVLYKFA